MRPRVIGQASVHSGFVGRLDEMSCDVAGADRATDDDESVVDELVHERGVSIPTVLFANATCLVPGWPVRQDAQEVPHARDARQQV
jgi:hypothetical protein